MRSKLTCLCYLCGCGIASSVIIGQSTESKALYARLHFPANVRFGMSVEELLVARPSASLRDTENNGRVGLFGAAEIDIASSVTVAYVYHFSNGVLAAVSYGRTSSNMLSDIETSMIFDKLDSAFGDAGQAKIKGAIRDLTARQWNDKKENVDIYMTATTRSTSLLFVLSTAMCVDVLLAPSDMYTSNQACRSPRSMHSVIDDASGRVTTNSTSSNRQTPAIDRLSPDAPTACRLSRSYTRAESVQRSETVTVSTQATTRCIER